MSFLNSEAIRDWCKKTFLKESNVLKTIDEVKLNEEVGKSVDALVVKEVFQSVSNGKQLVASAITDKGVSTEATDTFAVMADNIGKIESGGSGDFSLNTLIVESFGKVVNFNILQGFNVEQVEILAEE